MHRLHLGSQVVPVLLGWHESVRLQARAPQSCPIVLTSTLFHYRQPILADEVQTFKALITVHKVLQEGHPVAVKEAQANINWLESLTRGVTGEGLRGMDPHCVRESLQASSYGGEDFEFEKKS